MHRSESVGCPVRSTQSGLGSPVCERAVRRGLPRPSSITMPGCQQAHPNRISSSGRGCPDRFKLDQPSRPVFPGWCRTVLNCNRNCNPQICRSEQVVRDRPLWSVCWADIPPLSMRGRFVRRQGSSHDRTAVGAFPPPAGQPNLDAVASSSVLHVCGLARRGPGAGSSWRVWREGTRWVTATPATSSAPASAKRN